MKLSKDGISAICRKRRPASAKGCNQDNAVCFVRLNGQNSCKTLGKWGSPEVEKNYQRLAAEFYNRVLTEGVSSSEDISLAFLFRKFLEGMTSRVSNSDKENYKTVIRIANDMYPTLFIRQFSALCFRAVQNRLIQVGLTAKRPWSRSYANKLMKMLRAVFKWGISYDLVEPVVLEKIRSVPPLRVGDCDLVERDPVQAVPDEVVVRTLPFMYPTVADMVKIQRGACMRPCEVCRLRVGDIDRSGEIWKTKSSHHKTERFGVTRFAAWGKAETEILRRRCAGKGSDEFVFSPRDAMEERWERQAATRKTKVQPSQQKRAGDRRKGRLDRFRDHYDSDAYRDSIQAAIRAAKKANPPVLIPNWTPYQLRHAAVTATSLAHGREIASLQAGHFSLDTTKIYDHKAEHVAEDLARERESGWW